MARVQVGYDPRAEALQTTAAPNIQTVQESADPRASKAFQLAEALGSQTTQVAAAQITERANQQLADQARAWAHSTTVDDLHRAIKDGSLLPSQSPVFVATVQHIYGENQLRNISADVRSKVATGELTFAHPSDIDNYLQDRRKEALGDNPSPYMAAGFDKGFGNLSNQVAHDNMLVVNKQHVEDARIIASDNLMGVYKDVKDTPDKAAAAKALMDKYQSLRSSGALANPQIQRDVLGGLLKTISYTGDVDLLNEVLDQKTNVGTLRSVMKDDAAALVHHAQTVQFQNQKKAEASLVAAKAEESVKNAQQIVDKKIAEGTFLGGAGTSDIPILKPNGEVGTFNTKEYAQQALKERAAAANMEFPDQVRFWSTNGVQNPDWEKVIQTGVSNLASVGWTSDGKTIGQLSPAGQGAIDMYIKLANVNPGEADKYAGSKENQRLLSDIKFLVERGGMPNINDAATFVNQERNRGITAEDFALKSATIKSAVDDLVNPHFWTSTFRSISTMFGGNQDINITAIQADVRRRAELLVRTGQVSDANAAVEETIKYYSNSAVVSNVNNTLYFTKDLPSVPQGEDQGKWFSRFMKEVPGQIATNQKLPGERVRLEPNAYGGYTAMIGAVPVTDTNGQVLRYTKDHVTSWIANTYSADMNKAIRDRSSHLDYESWKKRVTDEYTDKNPSPYGGNAGLNYITSPGAYKYLKEQNALGKSAAEITDLMKKKGK